MELSSRTVDILRNFASINPNIVVSEGNTLKTMSIAKNLVAKAVIEENFPTTFGIYDLAEFLSVLNLVDNPSIEFGENNCSVRDGSGLSSVRYFYSDPEMLTAPKKDIVMPSTDVQFLLTNDTLSKIKRAAAALGHDEINIRPSNGAIEIAVVDSADSTSNSFSITVDGTYPEGADFNFVMGVGNLKLIGEDYEVSVSNKLISNLKSIQSETEYFIALEKSSTGV
jgi:hypothetical protein